MNNAIVNQYQPDEVSPPGETLEELLEEREMTQAELATRMGRPKKTINEIIKGKAEITPETALQLERVLGVSATFWSNRERHYRDFLARQKEQQHLKNNLNWLKQVPVKAMINLGWIQDYSDKIDQLRELLNFFAVTSPENLESLLAKELAVDFRKSQAYESNSWAIAAWLRQGEIEAAKISCNEYNSQAFKEALFKIRSLTVEPPEVFQAQMVNLCAASGVAVAFVPQLPKTRVCGATRWLTPNKALIQLSLRYKKNDHFWFAFFHEAGHILLHGKKDLFLESLDKKQQNQHKNNKEKEADRFAGDFLIDPNIYKEFQQANRYFSQESIKQLAQQIGIAPGIVVGRLQHDGLVKHSHCNKLKQTFEWKSIL
ncbi:MAG: HigA family addiction module antitoxin [Spirulinaceae cyanobacterium]